jgi:ubiquinone/menaquinone biosynthesis C-methylase UbiE
VLLNERTGLSHKVRIHCGSALDLPLEDASVDVVWMQHVGMNIQDKKTLLKEVGRVMRPQGRLALYEVFSGPEPAGHFPVPWASGPEMSFLIPTDEAQGLLQAAGFRVEVWDDVTRESTVRFRAALEKAVKKGPPPISLATLMGPKFSVMAANVLRSLEEDRLRVVQAVLTLARSVLL